MKRNNLQRPPVNTSGWLFYFKPVVCTLVILLATTDLFSQKYLVLEKLGTRKRFEYPVGSDITFRLQGEEFFRTATITDLIDSVIVLDFTFFSISAIDAINIRGRPTSRINTSPYPTTLVLAGVILFAGDLFNETVISRNNYTLNEGVTIASGTMVGVGLLWMFLKHDVRRLKRNWRLRVVDI